MGPRPDGRGKLLKFVVACCMVLRQWGRGQTAAESLDHGSLLCARCASMGPRPDGRGKSGARKGARPPFHCVNGAAARRPRKGPNPCLLRRGAPCVNGAAARRPRKAARAPSSPGRARSVNGAAARRPRKAGEPGRHYLVRGNASMGPRPDGRGKAFPALNGGNVPSVNGAAARRPRKVTIGVLAGAGHWRQWGRGQTAAERSGKWSHARGDSERQWGRGQTAAERPSA